MEIEVWGLVSLILFYLVIFLIGIYASRRLGKRSEENPSEDAMLAGRNLGICVGIFSMTATWVDGVFINGSAEVVFTKGLLWCQGPLGYALSLVFGGCFYATKMRDKGYVTLLDPFHLNYGKWMAAFFFLPNLIGGVLYYGGVLAALGDTVAKMINLDVQYSIIASGVVSLLYTLAGGMYSVTYTDVVELFFILLGLWLCIPFCLQDQHVGPISESYTHFWGTIQPMEVGQWLDGFLLLALGGVSYQEYYQRVLSSKSSLIARIVSYAAGCGVILVAIPPVIVGIMARNVEWETTPLTERPTDDQEASMILPIIMLNFAPRVVAYLGLGSIAAATMASTDAGILAASTQFTRIWYRNLFRPQASEREMLFVLRAAMVLFAAGATCVGLTIKSVYRVMYLSGDLSFIIIFPGITCLLYLESHCNAWGAGAAYITCLLLRLLCGEPAVGLPALIKLPLYDEDQQSQTLPFKTFIVLIGIILTPLFSKLSVCIRGWKVLKITSKTRNVATRAQNVELIRNEILDDSSTCSKEIQNSAFN